MRDKLEGGPVLVQQRRERPVIEVTFNFEKKNFVNIVNFQKF